MGRPFGRCYELNVSPNFYMLKPNPDCFGSREWGPREMIDGAFWNGIGAFP
jgi:hypothetical protein